MNPTKAPRYRKVNGRWSIEAKVKDARQLFDARDPSPFRERDLDDNFVEYIVSSLRELPKRADSQIVIYIENFEHDSLTKEVICESIRSHFEYAMDLEQINLKSFLRRSQLFFAIGFLLLVACLMLAQGLPKEGPWNILREGLVIFGWVSIWKPIELLLFDWLPIYEKIQIYKRILRSDIKIEAAQSPESIATHGAHSN